MEVILFAVQSLDGRITRGDMAGDDFGSAADKAHFLHELRGCDACVMGRATYAAVRRRLRIEGRPDFKRVVWTRSPDRHRAETRAGCLEFSDLSPAELVAALSAEGRRRCALLGGGETYGAWLRAGVVDELQITIEPRLFGAGATLAGCAGPGAEPGLAEVRWRLAESRRLGDAESPSLLLRYLAIRL